MTQRGKLYAKFLAGRSLSFMEFCQLLEAFGYRHVRTTGSHRAYHHVEAQDTRIIQPDGKDAKGYQVRQFRDTIERKGLAMEDGG